MAVAASSASAVVWPRRAERLWLCVPVIVLCAADGLLTLAGQPAEYWSGGYAAVNEAQPVAAWFLTLHPLAFAFAGVPYILLVAGGILWLPRRYAVAVAVIVALAHAFAVFLWCRVLFDESMPAVVFIGLGALAWQCAWRGTDR
jgi:hypothetical protein